MPEDEELKEERPDFCPETVDGEHVMDPHSITCAEPLGPGEQTIVDVHCAKCGRSGSFMVTAEDVNW